MTLRSNVLTIALIFAYPTVRTRINNSGHVNEFGKKYIVVGSCSYEYTNYARKWIKISESLMTVDRDDETDRLMHFFFFIFIVFKALVAP